MDWQNISKKELRLRFRIGYILGLVTGASAVGIFWVLSKYF